MFKVCKAGEPGPRQSYTGLTCKSDLPSETTLHVPHRCLHWFYKHNSLLTPSIHAMWATCQSDRIWTGPLFLLCWTESHVDTLLQNGKAASVLLRRSGPWKNNTNKFEYSKVPHVITEDAMCTSYDSDWRVFLCRLFAWIISDWLQENINLNQNIWLTYPFSVINGWSLGA